MCEPLFSHCAYFIGNLSVRVLFISLMIFFFRTISRIICCYSPSISGDSLNISRSSSIDPLKTRILNEKRRKIVSSLVCLNFSLTSVCIHLVFVALLMDRVLTLFQWITFRRTCNYYVKKNIRHVHTCVCTIIEDWQRIHMGIRCPIYMYVYIAELHHIFSVRVSHAFCLPISFPSQT